MKKIILGIPIVNDRRRRGAESVEYEDMADNIMHFEGRVAFDTEFRRMKKMTPCKIDDEGKIKRIN